MKKYTIFIIKLFLNIYDLCKKIIYFKKILNLNTYIYLIK